MRPARPATSMMATASRGTTNSADDSDNYDNSSVDGSPVTPVSPPPPVIPLPRRATTTRSTSTTSGAPSAMAKRVAQRAQRRGAIALARAAGAPMHDPLGLPASARAAAAGVHTGPHRQQASATRGVLYKVAELRSDESKRTTFLRVMKEKYAISPASARQCPPLTPPIHHPGASSERSVAAVLQPRPSVLQLPRHVVRVVQRHSRRSSSTCSISRSASLTRSASESAR